MKQKIVLAALTLIAFTTQSFAKENPSITRKIETTSSFEKIVVGNNINLMLVTDENEITVEGNAAYVNDVVITNKNGILSVNSNDWHTAQKIIVYVPVKKLSALEITGFAKVMAADIIDTPALNVLINGNCMLGLQTTGHITLQHPEDIEFTFEKVKNRKQIKTEILLEK